MNVGRGQQKAIFEAADRIAQRLVGPHATAEKVPQQQRMETLQSVAAATGLSLSTVIDVLSLAWSEVNEGRGAASRAYLGTDSAPSGPGAQRPLMRTDGTGSPLGIRMMQLGGESESQRPIDKLHDRLASAMPGRIARQLTGSTADAKARAVEVDALLLKDTVREGAYGALELKALAADDALLDMPLYRGMSAADPAVHALKLTGALIPQGTSSHYEAHKEYGNHTYEMDAYELTLDPFQAIKYAADGGVLIRTTLRELREQGLDVARKKGDSEGGFFVTGNLSPGLTRVIGSRADAFVLEGGKHIEPVPHMIRHYAGAVPQAGSWSAFLTDDNAPLKAARSVLLGEASQAAEAQVLYWTRKLKDLDVKDPRIVQRLDTYTRGAATLERHDYVARTALAQETAEWLTMRAAEHDAGSDR